MTDALKMDDNQFLLWRSLIEVKTGMVLPESRRTYLETSIAIRMREVGMRDSVEYYDFVRSSKQGEIEWTILVDRLSVQETSFFRHQESCDFIYKCIYEWRRSNNSIGTKPLSLWSAGCATGEEPYTLAIIAQEVKNRLRDEKFYFGVTGSDISMPALSKARRAIYVTNRLRTCEPSIVQKYFTQVSPGEYLLNEELRKRVCFVKANLLEAGNQPVKDANIITCQNVLIYFDKKNKKKILENLVEALSPGGVLLLGVGEIINWEHPSVERISSKYVLAYRKRA